MKKVLLLILSFSTIAYAGESYRDFLEDGEFEFSSDDERLFEDIAKNLFTGGALGPEELAFENATEPVGSAQGLSNYSNDPYFSPFAQNDEIVEHNRIREVGSEEIGSVSDTPFGASKNTDNGVFPILQDANQEEEFQAGVNQDDRQLPKPSIDQHDNKRSSSNFYLNTHLRRHTGEKPYKCEYVDCKKQYATPSGLTIHVRRHTGEKPYKCEYVDCKKQYATPNGLTIHMRRHAGERPYKCDQCGKRFTTQSGLNVHIFTHTGEKPRKCDQCGKRFTQSGDLARHILIHTGEKPHKCDQCGKRFTQKGSLTVHKRIHTGEKPHKCNQCARAFTDSTSRKRHMKLVHNLEYEKPQKCLSHEVFKTEEESEEEDSDYSEEE